MANMHGSAANCTSSSSSSFPPSAPITDLDEFSLFLHQIMHKGTNDLQYSFRPTSGFQPDQDFRIQPGPSRIPLSEASPGLNPDTYAGFASTGACLPENVVANVSSSSINSAENELNEYDCESEERLEGVGVEALTRPTTLRNPAKRGRAAEVHNLSEKRRRSRINEKMKALQNLIPNSNKTDKASMLDEAIEYLKQLQLQVQMLTMRNGVSLYPMFLPGVVQSNEASHMRMGYPEGNRPLNSNIPRSIPLERTNPTNILFTIPDHYPNQEQQTPVSNLRELNNSDSFGLETSNQIHPQSYQQPLPGYPKGICLEDPEKLLPSELVNADLSRTNTVGHIVDGKAAASVLFHDQASNLEEACILGRDYESRKILRSSDL